MATPSSSIMPSAGRSMAPSISTWTLPPSAVGQQQGDKAPRSDEAGRKTTTNDMEMLAVEETAALDKTDWLLHRLPCGPGEDNHLFELLERSVINDLLRPPCPPSDHPNCHADIATA